MALLSMRPLARRLADAGARAVRRTADDAWPLLQGTVAATVAWLIARYVLDREEPFFAPIAALIALNTAVGERGLNAVRLLQVVILGIVIGELTLAALAGGYASMAVAILVATALARALGGTRIVIAQAAIGAILTVAVSDSEAGVDRLSDALIGAGVALVFSQLLFAPEPVALLRRAEAAVLERLAGGLTSTARALEQDDDELATDAVVALRELPEDLTELQRMRRASGRVARRTIVGRAQRALVVRESENADHLDLLGSSCLMLARAAPSLTPSERRWLGPRVRDLSEVLAALARELGNRDARQRAADRALAVASAASATDAPAGSTLAIAIAGVRMVSTDVMIFAGIDLNDVVDAVRKGMLEQQVAAPPRRRRFGALRRWLTR